MIIPHCFSICLADPDLIYEKCAEGGDGFEDAIQLFPTGGRSGVLKPELSGGQLQDN